MAVGDIINKSYLSGDNLTSFSMYDDNDITPNGGTSYLYIAGYSWRLKFIGNYAFFGSPTHTVKLWHWDGSKWRLDGTFSSFKDTKWIYVNDMNHQSGGSINVNIPTWIWRVSFSNSSGYYKGHGDVECYWNGTGNTTDDTYPKGLIISIKGGGMYSIQKAPGSASASATLYDKPPSDESLKYGGRGGYESNYEDQLIYDTATYRGNILQDTLSRAVFLSKLDSNYVPIGITNLSDFGE